MGDCQNYDPFLGTLNIRCRNIIGDAKGSIILTTTHVYIELRACKALLQQWGWGFEVFIGLRLMADSIGVMI